MKEPDHYWLRDFEEHLRLSGCGKLEAIKAAKRRVDDAQRDLRVCVDEVFTEEKEMLRTMMRPCHQRRFDELRVEIWNG